MSSTNASSPRNRDTETTGGWIGPAGGEHAAHHRDQTRTFFAKFWRIPVGGIGTCRLIACIAGALATQLSADFVAKNDA